MSPSAALRKSIHTFDIRDLTSSQGVMLVTTGRPMEAWRSAWPDRLAALHVTRGLELGP
jgi:hypothetical protein